MNLATNQLNDLLWIDTNQDQSCFVVGTETGYHIYQTDPLQLLHSRDFQGAGGVGIATMLFRSNVIALVGGGQNPRYPPTKVILWDDKESKAIAELTFRTSIKSVKLRRDLIVVSLESRVYVYRFSDLELIDTLETCGSVLAVSSDPDNSVVACAGNVKGRINIVFYNPALGGPSGTRADVTTPSVSPARTKITNITAHESSLAVVSLSGDGSKVATASVKGTLIRVFDTQNGSKLFELRRGAERVDIYSISFSRQNEWLAVSSDKGTIHVFPIRSSSTNRNTSLMTKILLPSYFQSQWSFAQFRVPDYRSICAFGADPFTVVCLCADGSYYKAKFDPILGGEMRRVKYEKFSDIPSTRA